MEKSAPKTPETQGKETSQPRFDIQQLYVKEQSCKLPHAPAIFQEEYQPEIQLEMQVKHEKLTDNHYEVALRLTLTAKNHQRTAFLLEVQQAGIFILERFNEAQLEFLLQDHCPGILYPYARKVIADLVAAGGFPPLALAPINFEALYHQQKQQHQANVEQDKTPSHTTDSNKNTGVAKKEWATVN